jgi:hypothetical protein
MFEVKQYIKLLILHNNLGTPFTLSLPMFDVFDPASFDAPNDEGDIFAKMLTGGYMVREIDTRGGNENIVKERPGTNRIIGWDWYVDKRGRRSVV